jgi:hypothetical protein
MIADSHKGESLIETLLANSLDRRDISITVFGLRLPIPGYLVVGVMAYSTLVTVTMTRFEVASVGLGP